MKKAARNVLFGVLALLLVSPVFGLYKPQKAEALVSLAQCFAAKAVDSGIATAKAAPGAIMSVSVSNISQNTETGSAAAGTNWTSCFLKSLTKIIAKTLLHTFTQSVVNWINSGFEGSPSFVTNPEGFLADVVDQTVGRVIEDISPLLCSPFKLDIRFALGLNLSMRSKQEIHCRLSDVLSNVRGAYDSFVTGTVGSGNLSQWIHIAGTPSNNPYGAYIAASHDIGIKIKGAKEINLLPLNWGKGFKSWRSCKRWGPDVKDANNKVVRKGPCLEQGPIKTPGSVIQDTTSGTLRTTFDELELADEIDEVVGALINQLLVKAVTGVGGLLGASQSDSTSLTSAAGELVTNPRNAVSGADAKAPPGINCEVRYFPSTKEDPAGSKIYVPDDSKHQVWTDNLSLVELREPTTGRIIVKGRNETWGEYYERVRKMNIPNLTVPSDTRLLVEARYVKDGQTLSIVKPATFTWKDYFDGVKLGCENQWNTLIDDASADGLGSSGQGAVTRGDTPPPIVTPPKPNIPREISLGAAGLNQSHIYSEGDVDYGPRNAAFGVSHSSTYGGPSPHWWTASLPEPEKIKFMTVRAYPGFTVDFVTLGLVSPEKAGVPIVLRDFSTSVAVIKLQSSGPATITGGADFPGATFEGNNNTFTVTFNREIEANAVLVFNTSNRIALRSVKLYRPAESDDGTTAPPEEPFRFLVNPAPLVYRKPAQWNIVNLETYVPDMNMETFSISNIAFPPNKPKDGLSFRASYYECQTSGDALCPEDKYKTAPSPVTTQFNEMRLSYQVAGVEETKDVINNDGASYTSQVEVDNNYVTFAKNISLRDGSIVFVGVAGAPRNNVSFRIKIEAIDTAQANPAKKVVGTAKLDFAR